MKFELRRTVNEPIEALGQWKVRSLDLGGIELTEKLKCYLSKFTEGILDPDVAGKKPDRYVENLEKGFLGDFGNRYILAAYDNDVAIGILIGLPKEERLHIYSLHVSPDYRGKGVGTELLITCINDMNKIGVKEIGLDVHMNNIPAYNLYKKFGFIEFKGEI